MMHNDIRFQPVGGGATVRAEEEELAPLPAHRNRRYQVRRETVEERAIRQLIVDMEFTETEKRVRKYYAAWCLVNRARPWDVDSLRGFAASILEQMGASTSQTYLGALRSLRRKLTIDPIQVTLNAIMKLAQLRRAGHDSDHARDISLPCAVRLIPRIANYLYRMTVLTILIVGSRACDLSHRRHCDMAVCDDEFARSVSFIVRIAKNIRKAKLRRRINLVHRHLQYIPQGLFAEFTNFWRGDGKDAPLQDVDVGDVNRALKDLCALDGERERPYTSNSFRRCFMHLRIAECTDEDGTVDYERVSKFTGHLDARTIEAFYGRPLEQADE